MRILFFILLLIHGLIHFLGFFKSFGLAEVQELKLPISKFWGIYWAVAAFGVLLFGLLYYLDRGSWWVVGWIAAVVSQVAIMAFWADARVGTLPNVAILLVCTAGWFEARFEHMLQKERADFYAISAEPSVMRQPEELPEPVQRWLRYSGALEHPPIRSVFLQQHFSLKMKPGQRSWYEGLAVQHVRLDEPSFHWSIKLYMMRWIPVLGRDLFSEGKGEMLIQLLGAIPVVEAMDNPKIDQGALQRYLGEIVWYPSAALYPYIEWETLDDRTAKATMRVGDTSGSGVFRFNEEGEFQSFSAMRYLGGEEDAAQHEWLIEREESSRMHGIRIPTRCRATWKLPEGDWTWAMLEVSELEYTFQDAR